MAYNLGDLVSAVQDDLKDPSFSSTRITRYLNYGQQAIFNTHYFKFCEKAVTGALTPAEYTFDQQTDHQATIGGSVVDSSGNVVLKLDKDHYLPHRDFFNKYPDPSILPSQPPTAWTEFGDQLYFNCPVDQAYTLNQRYYRIAPTLTSTTDVPAVPETFRELLELFADYRSEKYRGNHDIAATYLQSYEDGLEAMNMRLGPVTQVAPTKMRSSRRRVNV